MEKKLIDSRILFGLFLILGLPFISLVFYSFISINKGVSGINIDGYLELFKSVRIQEIGKICLRSLTVSFTATIIAYLVSYLLVLYTKNKFQLYFLVFITLPFLANEAIRVFSWQHVLAENGVFNKIIAIFDKNDLALFNSSNGLNIYITMIITCIPFAVFICTATFKIIPEIYWRACNDLKISHISKFVKIALPMSKIAILASSIITFFIAFALSSEVNFLGGATKISTRGFVLSLMSASRYDAIFAFGTILLVLISICYIVFYTIINRPNEIKEI